MKNDLFDGKIGDKVFYIKYGAVGEITRLNLLKMTFSIHWFDSHFNIQTIDHKTYLKNAEWRNVFLVENEKELLILKLKYPPA